MSLDLDDPRFSNRASMSVTLFNPSGLFLLLSDLLGPLRKGLYLLWPLGLLALLTYAHNRQESHLHIDRIFLTLSFFQQLLLSLLAVNLFTKLMLGTTMAYHGLISQVFGFRLRFGFIPAFFVPKAPIRTLPLERQPTCYAASLVAKLSLFILGILSWAILRRSGSGLADLCLVLALAGLGSFLFTANPLWPADGYNWLSTTFKQPKLRKEALHLTGVVLSTGRFPSGLPRGAAFTMIVFAVSSSVFLAAVIFFVLQAIALGLERQFNGTGVVLFCLLMASFTYFMISIRSRKSGKGAASKQTRSSTR